MLIRCKYSIYFSHDLIKAKEVTRRRRGRPKQTFTKATNINSSIHWSHDAIISLMENVHEQKKKKRSASSITGCVVVMIS